MSEYRDVRIVLDTDGADIKTTEDKIGVGYMWLTRPKKDGSMTCYPWGQVLRVEYGPTPKKTGGVNS